MAHHMSKWTFTVIKLYNKKITLYRHDLCTHLTQLSMQTGFLGGLVVVLRILFTVVRNTVPAT